MSPRLLLVPLLGLAFLLPSTAAQASSSTLRAQVEHALVGSTAAHVGVAIDVDGLGAVDRRGSTVALPPASTQKLVTTDAALRLLGANSVERTQLRSSGRQYGGLLRGDLYLVASGDPFFTSANLLALAKAFAQSGITTISGHLVVDDTRYDRVRRGAGWKSEFVPGESGPLSAMALDGNEWRHDSSYLADPATPVLAKLRSYLAKEGVHLTTSDSRRGPVLSSAKVYASHQSSALSSVVRRILKESDNFGAELLLKEVGKVGGGTGSSAEGISIEHEVLENVGVSLGTAVDGSGLSSRDRTSTSQLLSLLAAPGTLTQLKGSLPIGCKDGTLIHRFCGTVAASRVFAKTGTLDTSRALTGWTYTRDGHLVAFSLLLSGFSSGAQANAAIDRAVVVLAGATVS